MHRLLFQLVAILRLLSSTCLARDDSLIVDTTSGSVRGRFQNVIHGLTVKQFLGIPYAQPPVGQLRFARPQPAKPLDGVRDAVQFGTVCPQLSRKDIFGEMESIDNEDMMKSGDPDNSPSEDCLFLNVYTPSQATSQGKLAVMVWIHGGGFTFGSASNYNPSVLVASHDVIVVTINYRLGVLGFFNIPGTDIKGNYGMHDQILALKWVQKNIANFGGDPNNVTIFGESAGGMSVSHHLISPLSKGLFQRAIPQSGSSASPFTGVRVNSDKYVKHFAERVRCDFDKDLVGCLRNKSWLDVVKAQKNISFPIYLRKQPLCTVVVDGEFLPDDPRELLNQGKINHADVMIGITAHEGALFDIIRGVNLYKDGADLNDVEYVVRREGFQMHPDQSKNIEDATIFEYTDQSDLQNRLKHRQVIMDITSDSVFIAPAVFEAKVLSKADVPVYFYLFDHHPHFCVFPEYFGSYHLVELFYVFGVPINSDGFSTLKTFFGISKFSELEVGLSLNTMKLWTSFAKYGNPNAGESTPVVTWPRYNSSGHVHLRISLNPKVEHSFRERKMAFWNDYIPKLAECGKGQEMGSKQTKDDHSAKEEL